jgi:acyl carrier protein
MSDVYEMLAAIIGEELDTPPPPLSPDTVLDDIPGWDSVTVAGVLLAIEERFGIVASRAEIDELQTAADLARLCQSRTA